MSFQRTITDEQVLYIRKHFKNEKNQALADAVGVSRSTVTRIQQQYHLSKSPEYNHERLVRAGKASVVSRENKTLGLTPESIVKRIASYKKTFREERARATFGLPQRTKMKVNRQPTKKCHHRSYLKQLGYILDEENVIAYWTDDTVRAVKLEAQPRLYYKFLPYETH